MEDGDREGSDQPGNEGLKMGSALSTGSYDLFTFSLQGSYQNVHEFRYDTSAWPLSKFPTYLQIMNILYYKSAFTNDFSLPKP